MFMNTETSKMSQSAFSQEHQQFIAKNSVYNNDDNKDNDDDNEEERIEELLE